VAEAQKIAGRFYCPLFHHAMQCRQFLQQLATDPSGAELQGIRRGGGLPGKPGGACGGRGLAGGKPGGILGGGEFVGLRPGGVLGVGGLVGGKPGGIPGGRGSAGGKSGGIGGGTGVGGVGGVGGTGGVGGVAGGRGGTWAKSHATESAIVVSSAVRAASGRKSSTRSETSALVIRALETNANVICVFIKLQA
jgi:hypothetical protein